MDNSQINFLPEDYLQRRRQKRTNVVCLSLFAVVMAGLIAAFVLDERRQAAAAGERQAINCQMELVARQLVQIDQMQQRKERMIRKADVTASLLERRPRHYLVALLTNSLPAGASLLSVELTTRELRPKQSKPRDTVRSARTSRATAGPAQAAQDQPAGPTEVETIRLTGLAPDDKVVSRFIGVLDGSPLFRQVDLVFSEEHSYNKQAVRRFMLQIELDSQAQVTDEMVRAVSPRAGAFE